MANDKNKSGKSGNKSAPKAAEPKAAEPTTVAVETAEPEETTQAFAGVAQLGTLVAMPIRLIDATTFKNQRTGDFTIGDSSEDGNNQSFKEMVGSIEDVGQKDPITVRPKHKGIVDHGMPYEVIKGFRRFAAINLLAQRAGTEQTATINVIIKELTDIEALEENLFENTARDNLTGPDLAWGAYNLQETYKANGLPFSGNVIAKRLGKNQPHIAKLLKIVSSAPVVSKAWQESKSPLTLDAMKRISEMDLDKQEEEYKRINEVMGGKGNNRGRSQKPPIESATNQAVKVATLLGNLASQSLIVVSINWEANLGHIGVNLKELTVPDIRIIAKLASDAFEKARAPKTAEAASASTQASEAEPTVSAEN
jgi:ParB/RepB/Spo0J family partition protein